MVGLYAGKAAAIHVGGENEDAAPEGAEGDDDASYWLEVLWGNEQVKQAVVEDECREFAANLVERVALAIEVLAGRLLEIDRVEADDAMTVYDACIERDDRALEDFGRHMLMRWSDLWRASPK